ncbi:hypothetical protein Tco_0935105 [Tanacetum coccineum]
MTTLADKAILSGANNRPPMLEKDMYDSWKSRMELYMMNRQLGRMILESIENGLLIWPTIEENGVTRPRKYSELSAKDAIQADCDVKATNIILQGLPPEVYALVSNHKVAKELWERIQLLMQGTSLTKQEREYCRSRYPTTNNQLRNSLNPRQQDTINDGRVTLQPVHGRQISFATGIEEGQATQTVITHNVVYQADDLDALYYNGEELYTCQSCSLGEFIRFMVQMLSLGFQNPFYMKKAQQLEPKLYDGNVIKNTSAILIPDSEVTLMLAEENFKKRFVPQTELSAEQAFWSQNSMNSSNPSPSCRLTKVEVPKVSMVNMSLKKLKHHLAGFDVVVKERIMATAITEGPWGAPSFDQYFELNELKAQSQEKDTIIKKLKERIKSLSGNVNEDKTYKQLYDSIKPTHIRSKEQCDALNNQVNQKSVNISDLNVSLQEKDLVITALKDELRKLKGKDLANNVVTKHTIAPEMLKIDVEPIAPRLLNNRTAHSDYLKHTQEQAVILREIVE